MSRPTLESILIGPIVEWAASWLSVSDQWDEFCVSGGESEKEKKAATAESYAWENMLRAIEARKNEILLYARQVQKLRAEQAPQP